MNYSVYKHTCPSGKVYIGITMQKPEIRWNKGLGYKKQDYFYKAILKYGWDNIKHEVLYKDLSKAEAENMIREQNTPKEGEEVQPSNPEKRPINDIRNEFENTDNKETKSHKKSVKNELHHSAHTAHCTHIRHSRFFFRNVNNSSFCS